MTDSNERTPPPLDPDRILDHERLTSIFGRWPSFHDSFVLGFTLDQQDASNHVVELVVHVYEISSEVTDLGWLRHDHNTLTTLRFEDVRDLIVTNLESRNVLGGLILRSEGDRILVSGERYGEEHLDVRFSCSTMQVRRAAPHHVPEPTESRDQMMARVRAARASRAESDA